MEKLGGNKISSRADSITRPHGPGGQPQAQLRATVALLGAGVWGQSRKRAAGSWDVTALQGARSSWEMPSVQQTRSRTQQCPSTLQQALQVELSLLVQLLHAGRAAGSQEDVHRLLP